MADNDKRSAPTQPTEDFYGRPDTQPSSREGQGSTPSSPRDEAADRTVHQGRDTDDDDDQPPRPELTEADEKGIRPREASDGDDRDLTPREASGVHPYDPRARHAEAALDDISDGDGPRSDAGTNPLPRAYFDGHPDRYLEH
ncbi:hypothetical protein [Corallococcus sp. CA053C]|uniref:hypothetical protein n=1 Tax=Corallococcus sp. CA053C TaxID=2316732 RepID=UPI001F4736D8|nr:hypothetical protein [Corallococcus sp. CA053C]